MRTASLICEYDPFHNGHKYMLDSIRKLGYDCIIACMSGNFTQRGEPAAFEKHTRAKAALACGADIVIELPVTYACAGAERFAFGGVTLLDSTGIVDSIFFGSECGDTGLLKRAAGAAEDDSVKNALGSYLSQGMTFALAREKAVCEIFGEDVSSVLREPNNILACEYIKALAAIRSGIVPQTVLRVGASHDGETPEGKFASASYIRSRISAGQDFEEFVPEKALEIFSSAPCSGKRLEDFEPAAVYRLRTMAKEDYSKLPDMSEGLENRFYKASRTSRSVKEFLEAAKCKRYTLSRIRRSVMHAVLMLTYDECLIPPQYIRLLGFSERGREVLHGMKKRSSLPIITRHADRAKLSGDGKKLFDIEERCDDIYSLMMQ